jgi:hypothetical protein
VGLLVLRPATGLLYQPRMIGNGDCGETRGMKIGRGNSEKTCPSATLSTTNPTWLDPRLNPGRLCGEPATNRLSYGAGYTLPCAQKGFSQDKVIYTCRNAGMNILLLHERRTDDLFFLICAVGLSVLRPLLAYCASSG